MAQPTKRLEVLRAHLAASETADAGPALDLNLTAARPQEEGSYCVVLPEKLTSHGPWLVRRSAAAAADAAAA